MTVTRKKLEKFVKIRNKSEFNSNLQFGIDLMTCELNVADLGEVSKTDDGGYVWSTPVGKLIEAPNGQMRIED